MAGIFGSIHLRHIDDCYRPDTAMTSDAGWMDGARRRVARADLPRAPLLAFDLFPHSFLPIADLTSQTLYSETTGELDEYWRSGL